MNAQQPEASFEGPVIPRPERAPGAQRAACAVVAPHLLAAYDRNKASPAGAHKQLAETAALYRRAARAVQDGGRL